MGQEDMMSTAEDVADQVCVIYGILTHKTDAEIWKQAALHE